MSIINKPIIAFIGICALSSANVSLANPLLGDLSMDTLLGGLSMDSLTGGLSSGGQWVRADKIGTESRGYSYAVCHYQTSSYSNFPDHRFSITIKGSEYSCPYSIKFDPVTNAWKW